MKKILIIGPFPEPTTGVSLANKVVLENLSSVEGLKADFINTSYDKFDENLGAFSVSKILFYLKINFQIFKVFKSDVIYLTPGQTFFGVVKYSLYILLTKLLDKEIIIHVHGNYLSQEFELLSGIKKKIFSKLLRCTAKGIVLSDSLRINMSSFIEEKNIYSIYNFVEDYLFVSEEEIINKIETHLPRVVFLSNLMEEKGIIYLFKALQLLEEEGFKFEAKIAGNIDAKLKGKIEAYFEQLKHVEYCGIVSGNDKKSLLLWANIFVLPTYYSMEGQPISILEAMATGNLVITTNHSGIPDIFSEGINGYYVEKQNSESIAETIKKASELNEKNNKIRKYNYLLAREKFRVNTFINNITKVIQA